MVEGMDESTARAKARRPHLYACLFFVKAKEMGEGEMHTRARRPSIFDFFHFKKEKKEKNKTCGDLFGH